MSAHVTHTRIYCTHPMPMNRTFDAHSTFMYYRKRANHIPMYCRHGPHLPQNNQKYPWCTIRLCIAVFISCDWMKENILVFLSCQGMNAHPSFTCMRLYIVHTISRAPDAPLPCAIHVYVNIQVVFTSHSFLLCDRHGSNLLYAQEAQS
jgi:hypothetical protein